MGAHRGRARAFYVPCCGPHIYAKLAQGIDLRGNLPAELTHWLGPGREACATKENGGMATGPELATETDEHAIFNWIAPGNHWENIEMRAT